MALQWVGTDLSGLRFHFWLSELCLIIGDPGIGCFRPVFQAYGMQVWPLAEMQGHDVGILRLQQEGYSRLGIQFGLRCGFGAAPW